MDAMPLPTPLVSTDWLARHLGEPALVVVDASWYLAAMNRSGRAEYEAGHIPGAVFWDLDELSDRSSPLPHMLPPLAEVARGEGRHHPMRAGSADAGQPEDGPHTG